MVWIEIVCDGCYDNPIGETYKKSVSTIKKKAKENGWKTINGKIYCPKCQERMKKKGSN